MGVRATHDDFTSACEAIGRTLAQHGHRLVVASDHVKSAERYATDGFVNVASTTTKRDLRIEVLGTTSAAPAFGELAKEHPGLFVYHPLETSEWWPARMAFLNNVDAVVSMGGKEGTFVIGSAAIRGKRPLAPNGIRWPGC